CGGLLDGELAHLQGGDLFAERCQLLLAHLLNALERCLGCAVPITALVVEETRKSARRLVHHHSVVSRLRVDDYDAFRKRTRDPNLSHHGLLSRWMGWGARPCGLPSNALTNSAATCGTMALP